MTRKPHRAVSIFRRSINYWNRSLSKYDILQNNQTMLFCCQKEKLPQQELMKIESIPLQVYQCEKENLL